MKHVFMQIMFQLPLRTVLGEHTLESVNGCVFTALTVIAFTVAHSPKSTVIST